MDLLIIGLRFIPASGANLYVFDEFGIGPVVSSGLCAGVILVWLTDFR